MKNKIVENLEKSLEKGEFKKYLLGQGEYNIPSRNGFFTDISISLYSGIYDYYKLNPSSKIDKIFENEIVKLLNGSPFEVMCAFEYCWRQMSCEERNVAPFKLNETFYLNLKNLLTSKKDILKNYKEYSEFGANLQDGAYQYAININKSLDEDYGRKIL